MSQPALALVPRTDPEFVPWVYASIVDDVDPAALQARLRETYPLAVVRRRGISGERVEVWVRLSRRAVDPDLPAGGETHDGA